MNLANALVFAALGWVMEMIPKAFPSCFSHLGPDGTNTRALWLGLMGALQLTIGLGFVLRAHLLPFVSRLISLAPAPQSGALALPNARSVPLR